MTISDEINTMEAELKARGLSLHKLCKSIGMPLSTVWRWRQGGDANMQTWTRVQEAYAAMVAE